VVRTRTDPGMIYGNARVSATAQDETGQVRQLKAAGCEKISREKITARRSTGRSLPS
jgi:DNA invertase Pin-like site-specific DNA recombinase